MSDVPPLPHVFLAFLSYTGGFSSNDTSIEWHDDLLYSFSFSTLHIGIMSALFYGLLHSGWCTTTFWIGSFFSSVTERYLLLLEVIFGVFAFLWPVPVWGWSVHPRLIFLFTSTACKASVFACTEWSFAYVRLSLPCSEYSSIGCGIKIFCVPSLVK